MSLEAGLDDRWPIQPNVKGNVRSVARRSREPDYIGTLDSTGVTRRLERSISVSEN